MATTMPLLAEHIGCYRIVRPLASGGMGSVYEGFDEALERKVAVKILLPEHAGTGEFRRRFVREARVLARVSHPNIAQVYSAGRDGERLYYVMEFVEGATLGTLIVPGGMAVEPCRELLGQCIDGLEQAYLAGIVHRDIKPGNLMRDRSGRIKIVDFGLARLASATASLTATGDVLGTPYYMSPEQALGATVDHRTDIYSLGATFYHLITGMPLFDGDSAVSIVLRHLHEPPAPVRSRRVNVPDDLASAIDRMVRKEAGKRFASYAQLRHALGLAAPDVVATARRYPTADLQRADTAVVARNLPAPVVVARVSPQAENVAARPSQRRTGLLLLLFLTLGAYAIGRADRRSDVPPPAVPREVLPVAAPAAEKPAAPMPMPMPMPAATARELPPPSARSVTIIGGTAGLNSTWERLHNAAPGRYSFDRDVRHGAGPSLLLEPAAAEMAPFRERLGRRPRPPFTVFHDVPLEALTASSRVVLRAWARTEGARLDLRIASDPRDTALASAPARTNGFVPLETALAIGPDVRRIRVIVHVAGEPGSRAWLDDLTLEMAPSSR